MANPYRKEVRYRSLVGLCALALSVGPLLLGLFHIPQEKILDRLFLKKEPSDEVVIVAIDNESLSRIGQWPWPRRTFATLLDALTNASVVGLDINFSEPSRSGAADDAALSAAIERVGGLGTAIVLPIELDSKNSVSTAPLEQFKSSTVLGFINFPVDGDAVVRRTVTEVRGYQSFARVIASAVNQSGTTPHLVPETFRIDYLGRADRFLTVSFADVLDGKIPARIFEHKIVLVGATAESLHDVVETPFGMMPGVVAHANAIETISGQVFFRNLPLWISILLLSLVTVGVFFFVYHVKSLPFLVTFFALLLLSLIGVSSLLFSLHIMPPILYLLLAFFASLILSVALENLLQSREKRFIKQSFQYYISADLVDELVRHPEKLVLGGEKRMMTILFSDVRGFTTISESMTPEALTSFMSEYFSGISDIVIANRGVIDKYIGDAIMAFWGAPLLNFHHAADACETALSIAEKVAQDNEKRTERGLPSIHVGFGINTGEVIVGNMGSRTRFNYTCVGDDVNFTSRLEGLTKEYGIDCIVSESTRDAALLSERGAQKRMRFDFRELDDVIVKGKKKPKKIFELLPAQLDQQKRSMLSCFAKGRGAYLKGAWDEALKAFTEGLTFCDDAPTKVFIARVQAFKLSPPTGWQGVYEFSSK